jgi:ornithine cyclodeaminase/alanine dehydrogenase-like protein (mu-crystallin family)
MEKVMLLLSEADVRQILTMEMALEAVEAGLRSMGLDEVSNIPRSRCQTDHAMLHVLSAGAKRLGYLGYKAYVTSKRETHFQVGLYDGKTATLLALMEADYLGQMRTGAASGVATKYMARPESSEVGVFGAGKQARTQLLAVSKVCKLTHAHVYSPNAEHRHRFAEEMSKLCGIDVVPAQHPEMAAEDKDIIITATTSREPVLNGHWISDGTHLNVIGSNFLGKAEVDVFTLQRCETIVVDSKEQARLEAGDFVQALEDGAIHWSDIWELCHVIVGRYPGRSHPQDVTLFKSLGIAIEDVAVAGRVYERARAMGLGKEVKW